MSASYPVEGGSGSVPTYANLAAFPSAASSGNGSLAIALDTDILYISTGSVWEVIADPAISPLAITSLTGDGTASGPGSAALTLATVNSNVGSFGTAANVATITVNAKGLVTAASNTAIQIAESQVTNLVTDLAAKQSTTLTSAHILVGNGSNVATDVAAGGDLTLANTGAFTLATVNSNVGSFGTASSVGTFTVNAKGLVTAASNTSIQIAESQVTNLVTDLAAKQSTTLTSAHILVGNGSNVATDVAMSGDVTISNAGVTAIGTNKVANSQLAQMAAHTFKGNNTGSTANALDLTATQLTAELNVMVGDSGAGGTKGLVPAPVTGDATKFLRGDGTWVTNSGDVTGPGSAVADHVVTFNGTTGKIIKDSGLTLAGTNTGDVTLTSSAQGLTISGQALTLALAASGVIGTVSATTQTFTGIKTFETQLIGKGTATNDSAASGYIGEYLESKSTGSSAFANTGVYDDLTSLSLTAGDWDVTAIMVLDGAGSTSLQAQIGISSTSGNSGTGLNSGENLVTKNVVNGSADYLDVPVYRVSIASTTTYYLKRRGSYGGTSPSSTGYRLSARRVR